MITKQDFLAEIKEKNSKFDLELIGRAYGLAEKWHQGQFRKSGDPYVSHPIEVAKILAELGMDEDTVVAGLLHDVVEDTSYTIEELEEDFGENIRHLVEGVTKLGAIVFDTVEERQAENFRKMFLAMSKDIRVLIIKLADRLHNLRTINFMNPEQIEIKCKETLEIYSPLASRLGMYALKFELEDIALKYLYPEDYAKLAKKVNAKREERQETLEKQIEEIKEALEDLDIQYDIIGRPKHFYSIYKKMQFQNIGIEEIFDLMAIRIIVENVKDCYAVLGIIHTMWTPIPGRFKDYIAVPKQNMYQSIHTTVIGENGSPFEIQIRTYEMHRIAEYGIAAHWKYKEGDKSNNDDDLKLAWLRQTLEWQKDMEDPKEFMETLKIDLFDSQVFVLTPKGDVLELPAGATPLDFAFKIHTDVGAKCVGARINGKLVPIDYVLNNGDIIEIVTSNNSPGPSIDWLKIAKSSTARSKIRQWLKKTNRSDNVDKGKDLLDKYLRKKGLEPKNYTTNAFLNRAMKELNIASIDELYLQVTSGGAFASKVGALLQKYYKETHEIEEKKSANIVENIIGKIRNKPHTRINNPSQGLKVKGMDDLLVRVAKCCNPVPGDEIIGFITRGRGVAVHRVDCPNIAQLGIHDRERFVSVEWIKKGNNTYDAEIGILSEDRKGLFSDISRVCESMDIKITAVNAKTDKDNSVKIVLTLQLSSTGQMAKILRSIRSVDGVYDIYRI
ncbi:MAG: RelA/SpoT family protein [Anaerovoracaceae bacterium]